MNELDSALYSIDPGLDREQWFKVLAAYKVGGGLQETADDWSAGAGNYDRQEFRSTWRSIRPGYYTEKTLFYMARQKGWLPSHADPSAPKPVPIRTPVLVHSPTKKTARAIWNRSDWDDVESHPYALKKKITHAFGAQRGIVTGSVVGKKADCLVIPNRNWAGNLVGVECINPEGRKQSWGNKGILILGHPEGAEVIHVVEGWATSWAVFQLFPRPHAVVVAFGKQMDAAAQEADARYGGEVLIHREIDNRDLWDVWDAGDGEQYRDNVLRDL